MGSFRKGPSGPLENFPDTAGHAGAVPVVNDAGDDWTMVAPGAEGGILTSDGERWARNAAFVDDPPAMFLPIFGDQWVAFSESQITESHDEPPKYRWDTGLGPGINWPNPAIAPDGSIYYTSTSGNGIMRVFPRGSGPIPRYKVAGNFTPATAGKLCVFAGFTGDAWVLLSSNSLGEMQRWFGDWIRQSTFPTWVAREVFTGMITSNENAFDAAENLWVTDGSSRINRYNNVGAAPGALVADVEINGANWPSQRTGLAISEAGNLWVANYVAGAGSIRMLNAAGIAAIVGAGLSNPAPTLTITGVDGFLGIDRIAFDYGGNLWLSAFDTTRVGRIPAAQLGTGGTKTCDIVLTGGGALGDGNNSGPEHIRFFPGYGPRR